MKRVVISSGKIGLVLRDDHLLDVLRMGKHWIGFFDKLIMVDAYSVFQGKLEEYNTIYNKSVFKSNAEMVEVAENQIALVYIHGKFHNVLNQGSYYYFNTDIKIDCKIFEVSDLKTIKEIDDTTLKVLVNTGHVKAFNVAGTEEGVIFVNGEYHSLAKSGMHYFWSRVDALIEKTDVRTAQMEISGQEMLSKDKANLRINFFAQYRVTDVYKALVLNKEFEKQLYITLQLALREYVGTLQLDDFLENKNQISEYVIENCTNLASELGVKLIHCGVRDIILPGDVKEIMNQVLVAQKKAQANVITRREENASTRNLLNTAKLLEENQMLFRLKEMEFMENIANTVGEVTLHGGNKVLNQFRELFSSDK